MKNKLKTINSNWNLPIGAKTWYLKLLSANGLLNACKDIGLAVNIEKNTKYMQVGCLRGMLANEHITVGSNSYVKVNI